MTPPEQPSATGAPLRWRRSVRREPPRGESRAPAAGAEDGNRPHARAPRRRSVPARKRTRFDRCRKTISVATADAAMTLDAGLPSAYATGGTTSVASTEPADTYLVSATV